MNYEVNDFEIDVIEASRQIPVVVDFWAEWCAPCKALGPVLEKLAAQNAGAWKLAKVDTDENQELAFQFGIRSIPNVKLFIDGEVVDEFMGAIPEKQIVEWLKKNIPGKGGKQIDEAERLITDGEIKSAKKLLNAIIAGGSEPNARALLAKLLFFEDPAKANDLIRDGNFEKQYLELAESLQLLTELLTQLEAQERLPESPMKELYIEAIDAVSKQNFAAALDKAIEIIRTDRYYMDDAARKLCIAIFKYLGEEHPLAGEYRRPFGSALYV